jgi:hypothetical protein
MRRHLFASSARARVGSFGQPGFPKALNKHLRARLPEPGRPGDIRRYCKGGIELKQTRCRFTGLSVTSEMGESGRETAVSCRKGGVLTLGFLPCDDGLVKATKLDKGQSYPKKRPMQQRVYRAHANGAFKALNRFLW